MALSCCGKPLFERDHGTWIGWFCPLCRRGGSIRKPPEDQWTDPPGIKIRYRVVFRTRFREWNMVCRTFDEAFKAAKIGRDKFKAETEITTFGKL